MSCGRRVIADIQQRSLDRERGSKTSLFAGIKVIDTGKRNKNKNQIERSQKLQLINEREDFTACSEIQINTLRRSQVGWHCRRSVTIQ